MFEKLLEKTLEKRLESILLTGKTKLFSRGNYWAMNESFLSEVYNVSSSSEMGAFLGLVLQSGRSPANYSDGARGIISIHGGIMYNRENMMTRLLGLNCYETIGKTLDSLIRDPGITEIIFDIDSPGGVAAGADILTEQIYQARAKKPITAYIEGECQSAAYWIASACGRIVASPLSRIGCIGAVFTGIDWSRALENAGIREHTFVSSQTPKKNADLSGVEKREEINTVASKHFEVFETALARNRNVDVKEVTELFGAGASFASEDALERKMIDEIQTDFLRKKGTEETMETENNQGSLASKAGLMSEQKQMASETNFEKQLLEGMNSLRGDVSKVLLSSGEQNQRLEVQLAEQTKLLTSLSQELSQTKETLKGLEKKLEKIEETPSNPLEFSVNQNAEKPYNCMTGQFA